MCYSLQLITALQLIPYLLFAQLTIIVHSVAPNTPYDTDIYVAGNFNGWSSGDPAYVLQTNELGILEIQLNIEAGTLAYKFTRGSWDTTEGTTEGNFRPNRTYNYSGGLDTLRVNIEGWEGQTTGGNNNGTASINVSIINESFYIPQLDRYRKIWIYLPPEYAISTQRYPVLYLHDGQNLFDRKTSFSGEWEVDESLNQLFSKGDPGIIVVGINNGDSERINEYTPWVNPEYGGGQGESYIDFIVENLKPYIDEHYRTRPDQPSTGIMGSSLGGLISLYAAMEYQDVFGKVGIFSPALWFSPLAYTHISEQGKQNDLRFYLLAGRQESSSMSSDLVALYNNLLSAGFQTDEIQLLLQSDGQHSEWFWAREFPAAYTWLFAEETPAETNAKTIPLVKLSSNSTKQEIRIQSTQILARPNIQIFAKDGKVILPATILQGEAFNSSLLSPGTYLFIIRDGEQIVNTEKVIIKE